jgi:hypothetical protein
MLTRTARALREVGHHLGRETARGLDGAGKLVWPLAVGVVLAPRPVNGRSLAEDRLRLALGAYRMGHFLLDLIDVPAWAATDDARAWAPVWELVERARADAVIVHGESRRVPRPPTEMRNLPIHLLTPDGR